MSVSDRDRKILWGRSGNRCALCRRILVAERTSADDEAVVGDEAHIAAQSPGGPRYGECDPNAVDSYENLILLCKVDHKKVDDQSQHFTAARLRQAKADHEAWVERALRTPPEPPSLAMHGAEGTQVGNNNHQTNIFNANWPGDDPRHLDNPIIATIEKPLTRLTVDGDPPKEIPGSGQKHVIFIKGRSATMAVLLKAMHPVVIDRRPPRRVCRGESRIGAWPPPRPFTADLDPGEFDTDRPALKARRIWGRKRDFPFTVTSTDIEQFEIKPRVTTGEVAWILELDWEYDDRHSGTTIIDDDGKPFELYPTSMLGSNRGLDWGCGLGHRRDCPAERLTALRRAGSQSNSSQSDLHAADIEEEFPGWSVFQSDAGTWYATPVGAHGGSSAMVYSDTADGLRMRLQGGKP